MGQADEVLDKVFEMIIGFQKGGFFGEPLNGPGACWLDEVVLVDSACVQGVASTGSIFQTR